jgi:hypothetical protein
MNHKCNAWCFGGVHAVLYDVEPSEVANLEGASRILAAQNGMEYVGFSLVQPQGVAPMGTPTREGIARGRVVIWGRRN